VLYRIKTCLIRLHIPISLLAQSSTRELVLMNRCGAIHPSFAIRRRQWSPLSDELGLP
jgi:hypothetical protein